MLEGNSLLKSTCMQSSHNTYSLQICITFNVSVNMLNLSRLSADGKRTLLVNINSDAYKPEGWESLADEKPDLVSFSDISIYELHIRDFRSVHCILF